MANKPYPFIYKDSTIGGFSTIDAGSFSAFSYGDIITGSEYPYSSSVQTYFLNAGTASYEPRLHALKNTLNYYVKDSKHYSFSSSLGDKSEQEIKMISIPSIFYGTSIKKGSITCKWYLTGTLIAELQDIKRNGELIQVYPQDSNSGSVAGVALYNEGFILLTGSWSLHPSYTDYFGTGLTYYPPSWKYYMNSNTLEPYNTPSSSFEIDFEGVNYIETINMFAYAEQGEFNHSNNPTFIKYDSRKNLNDYTSSYIFSENEQKEIINIVKTNYDDIDPILEKTTYISHIGIYDEHKNLIAIAKMSTPIRKRPNDNLMFKMKLDI
jgi:hypothetical protein